MVIIIISVIALLLIGGLLFLSITPRGIVHPAIGLAMRMAKPVTCTDLPVEKKREKFNYDAGVLCGALISLHEVKDFSIPADGGGSAAARLYDPDGQLKQPVILFFHGGGFVYGGIGQSDSTCRLIASKTGCNVVSIDYPLSPENRFPAAMETCYAALEWVYDNAESFGSNPDKIILAGDSAGGNLAASLAQMTRDRKGPPVAAQLLFYPWLNPSCVDTASYNKYGRGYLLDREDILWFREQYTEKSAELTNPYVSPYLAENLKDLPPLIMVTAQFDVLHDEGVEYSKKLKAAGGRVKHIEVKGVIHGFLSMEILVRGIIHRTLKKAARELDRML